MCRLIRRVFCRVGEQIGDDLLGTRRIGEQRHRLIGHIHRELVLLLVNQRPDRCYGAMDDDRGIDRLLAQRNLVAADSRHIEQVVDQVSQILRLPVNDLEQLVSRFAGRHLPQGNCVANRGQRVAQLVGQHGQELVLLPIGVFDAVIEPRIIDGRRHALGQVLRQRDMPLGVVPRRSRK